MQCDAYQYCNEHTYILFIRSEMCDCYAVFLERSKGVDISSIASVCQDFNQAVRSASDELRNLFEEWFYVLTLHHSVLSVGLDAVGDTAPYTPKTVQARSSLNILFLTYNVVKNFPSALQRVVFVYMSDCLKISKI